MTFLKRYLPLTLLFILGLMLGLIVFLPLSVVAQEIEKNIPGVRIGNTSGHFWQGRFSEVSWQQFNQASFAWELDLAALFEGQIVAQIDLSHAVVNASSKLALPINHLLRPGKVQIIGAQAQIDIDQLTPFAPYPLPKVSGQLTVFVEQLMLDMAAFDDILANMPLINLAAPLRFSTSKITVMDNLAIGQYTGQVSHTKQPLGYKLTLQSLASELTVSGFSYLSKHELKSQYLVKPSLKTAPQLTKLLDIMGQKLQNGDYSFNTAYAL